MWNRRMIVAVALGATGLLAGVAGAQDAPKPEPVELRVKGSKGTTWKFERTVSRKVTCPQLETDSDHDVVEPYSVTVVGLGADGALDLELAFGNITGKVKAKDGTTLEFDASKALPKAEAKDRLQLLAYTAHANTSIKVTVDGRGCVTAVSGYKEAVAKALEDTPFKGAADDMPAEESNKVMQVYLPPLPAEDHDVDSSWKDEQKLDFGARQRFSYERTWTLAIRPGGAVALTAKLLHVPLATVPEGQSNAGKGAHLESRSADDGMVLRATTMASFEGEGNFDVEAHYKETIARKK